MQKIVAQGCGEVADSKGKLPEGRCELQYKTMQFATYISTTGTYRYYQLPKLIGSEQKNIDSHLI